MYKKGIPNLKDIIIQHIKNKVDSGNCHVSTNAISPYSVDYGDDAEEEIYFPKESSDLFNNYSPYLINLNESFSLDPYQFYEFLYLPIEISMGDNISSLIFEEEKQLSENTFKLSYKSDDDTFESEEFHCIKGIDLFYSQVDTKKGIFYNWVKLIIKMDDLSIGVVSENYGDKIALILDKKIKKLSKRDSEIIFDFFIHQEFFYIDIDKFTYSDFEHLLFFRGFGPV